MAAWQIPIEFVPAKWAEEHNFEVELLYGEDCFDTTCAWVDNQPTKDFDAILSSILPKADSWSEKLSLWGNEKTHDISVWHEDGDILSIGFRIDLRENITNIMSTLCKAAITLNCVLFIPGQKAMLNPNIFELKQYILNQMQPSSSKTQRAFSKNLASET